MRVPLHSADGRVYPREVFAYQLGSKSAVLRVQPRIANLSPSPSTAVEVLVEKAYVSSERIWELASTGRRQGCLEIVRFFHYNPLACISVASHAFFDANRVRNPSKAKVAASRVIVRVYDTHLDEILETSDAVNGKMACSSDL